MLTDFKNVFVNLSNNLSGLCGFILPYIKKMNTKEKLARAFGPEPETLH